MIFLISITILCVGALLTHSILDEIKTNKLVNKLKNRKDNK
jgi:hypothetical protein